MLAFHVDPLFEGHWSHQAAGQWLPLALGADFDAFLNYGDRSVGRYHHHNDVFPLGRES